MTRFLARIGLLFQLAILGGTALQGALQDGQQHGAMLSSRDLRSELSANASIYYPGSEKFANATARWQTYKDPNITMVVEVASEEDVKAAIRYANSRNIPFLAVDGSHGAIDSLGNVRNGIQIWMRKLKSITIDKDGKTATIGGGPLSGEVMDTLWAAGKQTATGACKCTGMLGPMLGGGHGWLQGRYGLAADNLVEARLVLANATAINVSPKSNSDLFWAIRGAGHNFGVITQFRYRIYDVPPSSVWTVESFIFTSDKVEKIYDATNKLTANGTQPAEFINFSYFIKMPEVDPKNLVIEYFILYEGTPSEEAKFGKYFHDIGPYNSTSTVVKYPQLSELTGNGFDGPNCHHGASVLRFPVGLREYNVSAQRAVFDKFNSIVSSEPALSKSIFLNEGYSLTGVKAVPESSTAFPDRFNNLLLSSSFIYKTEDKMAEKAMQAGKDIRSILLNSSGSKNLYAYVNYAHGDESLEAMYGYEPWRLQLLRSLKKKYDPKGKFNYYAPIN